MNTASSMDANWTRWCRASLNVYFTNVLREKGIAFTIEGQDQSVSGESEWVVLRVDGPNAKEPSAGVWHIDVELSFVVSSVTSKDETHRHAQIVGIVQSAMTSELPVYKYGADPAIDTEELLGCFQLRRDDREAIVTSYLGRVEVDVTLEQTNVESRYRMLLIL
jgi:hypothetical protein